jgi:hypothetical protein
MTLDNLSKIGRLKPHEPTRDEVTRLLASAETTLRDARLTGMSTTSRLDLAYKAIMQAARMTVLDGFRRARNQADYEGAEVEDAKARECVDWAESLIADVRGWLTKNRPDLT